jgi:hypothetical protein
MLDSAASKPSKAKASKASELSKAKPGHSSSSFDVKELELAGQRAEETRIAGLDAVKKREIDALRERLSALEDGRIRSELSQSPVSLADDLNRDSTGFRWKTSEEVKSCCENLRIRIQQAEQEEMLLREEIEDRMRSWETSEACKQLPGFASEYEQIKFEFESKELKSAEQSERLHLLSKLEHKLGVFVAKAENASGIDLSGLEEDKMPVVIPTVPPSLDRTASAAELKDDIGAYYSQLFHLDEAEGQAAEPLYREAMACDVETRLDIIRDKLKRDCANLRHEKFLTGYFLSELTNALSTLSDLDPDNPLLQEARAILTSTKISREQYGELSLKLAHAAKIAAEKSLRTEITGTVQEVLSSFGYRLIQYDNETEAGSKRHRFFEGPEKGYRVEMSIADNGQMATRLVRVVGEESENNVQSFVQKQKDTEAAHKWCSISRRVEEELEAHGLRLAVKKRVEPEEEGWKLPVLVDARLRETQTTRAKRAAPRWQAQKA